MANPLGSAFVPTSLALIAGFAIALLVLPLTSQTSSTGAYTTEYTMKGTANEAGKCHCDPHRLPVVHDSGDIGLCEERCHRFKAPDCPNFCSQYRQNVVEMEK